LDRWRLGLHKGFSARQGCQGFGAVAREPQSRQVVAKAPALRQREEEGIKPRRIDLQGRCGGRTRASSRHDFPPLPGGATRSPLSSTNYRYKLANDGQDTRAIQHYLGHRNTQHTTRYTE
jgi:hypothetical protein